MGTCLQCQFKEALGATDGGEGAGWSVSVKVSEG